VVSQQEAAIRSLQNQVTTVQSNDIERLKRIQICLDMQTQKNNLYLVFTASQHINSRFAVTFAPFTGIHTTF
jgi:hypothetical protein